MISSFESPSAVRRWTYDLVGGWLAMRTRAMVQSAELAWRSLAHPKRRRFHLHFTPTSSSWLNLVERWFKEITDKPIRRGSFRSVDELVKAIDHWSEHWNNDPKPFVWHRTADEIIAKVRRGRAALDRVINSATHH